MRSSKELIQVSASTPACWCARYAPLCTARCRSVLAIRAARPDALLYVTPGLLWSHLRLNMKLDVFKDIRVRKAVAHAIDRNVLVKNVVEGYGMVANQPLHQWTEGYDARRQWPYEFNPQKSRQLLAEAGFAGGLDIDFISPEGRYTKDKEVAQAVAGMLQNAGFRVKHQSVVWNRFVETFNGSLRDECLNVNWFASLAEAQGLLEAWRQDYNESRPHSALNDLTPAEYARKIKEMGPA